MKHSFKLFTAAACIALALNSCDKKDPLATPYTPGTAASLTATATSSAPATADSSSIVNTFTWTTASYDRYPDSTVKYTVQLDSAGKNFSNPVILATFTGPSIRTVALTAKQLNSFLMDGRGYPATVPVDLEIRVVTSKSNFNEQYSSNIAAYHYTPYIPAMPQVAPVPVTTMPVNNELYMVGDMTAGGWNNPVPVPSQKLTRTGNIYSLILHSNGTGQYLLLPVNGDWGHKYAVQNSADPALQGYFGYNVGSNFNSNFNGPALPGTYLFRYDVSTGAYFLVRVGY